MKSGHTAAELVFIPSPGGDHLVPTVELARRLVDLDHDHPRLSITILNMELPSIDNVSTNNNTLFAALSSRIKFIDLPEDDESVKSATRKTIYSSYVESRKPQVKEALLQLMESPGSPPLAGVVLNMFCTCLMDVADELKLPSYVFYNSNAAGMATVLHAQYLYHQNKLTPEFVLDPGTKLQIPGLRNSVPARLLPTPCIDQQWAQIFFEQVKRFRHGKGIIVDTFEELESSVLRSFVSSDVPPVYALGPVLSITGVTYVLGSGGTGKKRDVVTWLDGQPDSSVVFLCFGRLGCFCVDQVREVARALEKSGHRFLWSLRRAPPNGTYEKPSDYSFKDLTDVLPEGFLDRTAEIGRVVGWVPQVDVLGHPAVGGFVSHCGWSSMLESMWFGVPIATWPMFAEQLMNAFQLVAEMGLAVEIKMDYRIDTPTTVPIVSDEEIERGIRRLMEPESEVRKKMGEMKEKLRTALMDGGSSSSSVRRFIEDVFVNMSS